MAEKLVRDRIPTIAPHRTFRQATHEELPALVIAKLREEAAELLATAPGSDLELLEAADLMDVVDRLETIAPDRLRLVRRAKSNRAGLFWNRTVMHLDDDETEA